MKTITINTDGSIEFLGDTCPLDLPLANAVRRRVSVIEPTKFWKKKAFQILRRVAGETGAAAAFTRRWSGPWRVTILATGQTEVFQERSDAIAWEINLLNEL
jgi:hypothetical protein